MTESRTRRWRSAFGYALAVLALCYAARHVGLGFGSIVQTLATLATWQWLVCLGLFALHITANAIAYSLLMRSIEKPAIRSLALYRAAWTGSLLAKYVPGGVWQIAGRGLLLVNRGVRARAIALSGVFEQVVSLGWCLAIALAAVACVHGWSFLAPLPILLGLAACLFTPRISASFASTRGLGESGLAMLIYGLAMLPFLGGYLVLLPTDGVARTVFALFAGTIAGVITFFAPGGLGVRESVTALFAGSSGESVLIGMAAARLLMLTTEVLAAGIGLAHLRRTEA